MLSLPTSHVVFKYANLTLLAFFEKKSYVNLNKLEIVVKFCHKFRSKGIVNLNDVTHNYFNCSNIKMPTIPDIFVAIKSCERILLKVKRTEKICKI